MLAQGRWIQLPDLFPASKWIHLIDPLLALTLLIVVAFECPKPGQKQRGTINYRRSFIYSLIDDPKLRSLNATFTELQKIVHLLFIAGEDFELTEREKELVEGTWLSFNGVSGARI